jgi:two-component system response regulator FixJ
MIFVVDDDAGARDSLRLLLELEGFEVQEFASSEAFLKAGGAGEGDGLILDLHIPGMSGIELLETMRGRGDTHPVIITTGLTDNMIRKRASAAGALAILEKPYQAKEILRLVRRTLDQG